jgi:hypothetical protein
MVWLITVTGVSGAQYSVWFEADDIIDAEMFMRDCNINGDIEGELQEVREIDFHEVEYIQ